MVASYRSGRDPRYVGSRYGNMSSMIRLSGPILFPMNYFYNLIFHRSTHSREPGALVLYIRMVLVVLSLKLSTEVCCFWVLQFRMPAMLGRGNCRTVSDACRHDDVRYPV